MTSENKTGPQYPAKGGAKISGDPIQGVCSQGALGGAATCEHSQELSPGLLELSATGDTSASVPTTASVPSTASQPLQKATPVVVGPPPSVPYKGPSPRSKRKLRARLKKFARSTGTSSQSESAGSPSQPITEETGTISQPTPSTSQGTPDPLSGQPEAMDTGALASSRSPESDDTSDVLSEGEDTAASGPAHPGPAEGETGGGQGTAAGTKRKPESGPTPPTQGKGKKKRKFPPAGQTFRQAEEDNLLGVVLVQGHPHTVLTRVQLNHIREQLLKGIEAEIDSDSPNIPLFNETGIRHGRLHLSCTDEFTFEWLQSTVDGITVPAADDTERTLRIQLVTPAEVPKLLRAEVHLTGPPPGVPKFLKLIKGQNPRLHPERWILRHQQSSDQHMLMIWSIDQESADALQEVGDRPHFGLGRASFRVTRRPGPSEAPSH